jgi:hypothetical protein
MFLVVLLGSIVILIFLVVGIYELLYRTSEFGASFMDGRTRKWGTLSSGIMMGIMFGVVPGFIAFHMTGKVWAGATADLTSALAVGYGWYRLDRHGDQDGSGR